MTAKLIATSAKFARYVERKKRHHHVVSMALGALGYKVRGAMKKEEIEAGKFYWVEWCDGEIDVVCAVLAYKKIELFAIGLDDAVKFGPSGLSCVICECVKPEVEG